MRAKISISIITGWLLVALIGAAQIGAQPPSTATPTSMLPEQAPQGRVQHGVTLTRSASSIEAAQVRPAAQVLTEDFEGSWPGPWNLYDYSSTDNGTYLWGKRDCTVHSGNYAGWAAGGGSDGKNLDCGNEYPANTDVRAFYGPIDLSNATSAIVTFYLTGKSEAAVQNNGEPYDFFFIGSDTQITGDFWGSRYWSNWTEGPDGNGFWKRTLDLSQDPAHNRLGQNEVWIAIEFLSDSSVQDIGFFIDDIQLDITTPEATPTSTTEPTRTPIRPPTRTPTQVVGKPTLTPHTGPSGPLFMPLVKRLLPSTATPKPTTIATPDVPVPCGETEPNDDFNQADPLNEVTANGRSCIGTFPGGDTGDINDIFKVNLNAGQTIDIRLRNIPFNDDYDLYVLDAPNHFAEICGGQVCKSTNPGAIEEHLAGTVQSSGTYYIWVFARTKHAAEHSYVLKPVIN